MRSSRTGLRQAGIKEVASESGGAMARLTIGDLRRLLRQAGIKDVTGARARQVRRFLEESGVLVRTGRDAYVLGPMVRFQDERTGPRAEPVAATSDDPPRPG